MESEVASKPGFENRALNVSLHAAFRWTDKLWAHDCAQGKKKNDKKRQISESTSSKYSFKYYATFTNKTVYKIEVLSQRNSIRP